MKKKYMIAGLVIDICGADDAYFEQKAKKYQVCTLKKTDVSVTLSRTDEFIFDEYNSVMKIGESQYFYEGKLSDVIIFYDEKLCRIVAKAEFNKSYNRISVVLSNIGKLCSINQDKFFFNVFGIAMHYLIRMYDGFVFHSSAICYKKNGVAFSADSGTGKSTHTSLWLENISGVKIINDDTPIIRVTNKREVVIYGTPWAGTTGINANISSPLKALIFVNRADENSIVPISSGEAIRLFLEGVRPSVSALMHLKTIDAMDIIMKKTKMYSLFCNTSPEAAFTVRNEIF